MNTPCFQNSEVGFVGSLGDDLDEELFQKEWEWCFDIRFIR